MSKISKAVGVLVASPCADKYTLGCLLLQFFALMVRPLIAR